jgi:hypothetical protein
MGDLNAALLQMADFIGRYAVTLAALGVLTMAILEAVKKLFNLRQVFQRNALEAWLGQDASGRQAASAYTVASNGQQSAVAMSIPALARPYEWRQAYAELMHLSTGLPMAVPSSKQTPIAFSRSVDFALFELELPQMMGQLQEAADAALNHPASYPHWFTFVTRGVSPNELRQWQDGLKDMATASDADRKALGELYGRIRLLVRRQLDAFQTVTAYRWREWNQLYSWALGFVLMFVAQIVSSETSGKPLPAWHMLVAVSLLGGLLAPVAKDLVDALAKIKR